MVVSLRFEVPFPSEHLFVCLPAICLSSFDECLFGLSGPFHLDCFLVVSSGSSYILDAVQNGLLLGKYFLPGRENAEPRELSSKCSGNISYGDPHGDSVELP